MLSYSFIASAKLYVMLRLRDVNFSDSEVRELPMRHKNGWMGQFDRRGLER